MNVICQRNVNALVEFATQSFFGERDDFVGDLQIIGEKNFRQLFKIFHHVRVGKEISLLDFGIGNKTSRSFAKSNAAPHDNRLAPGFIFRDDYVVVQDFF